MILLIPKTSDKNLCRKDLTPSHYLAQIETGCQASNIEIEPVFAFEDYASIL